MDPELRLAIDASNLQGVRDDVLAEMLEDARVTGVPAGSVIHWEGDHTAHLELVVDGLIRVHVTAPDGRTMTIRYCRRGALLGAMSLFTTGFVMPATAQALVETRLLLIAPDRVRRLTSHASVAAALIVELSERAKGFLHEIPGATFGTVRERVARHLLDLARDAGDGTGLAVAVSQQEIADAAGTVREVVVRVLRDLRDEGLIRTERGRIVLLDADRLVDEEIWNLSS